MIRDETFIARFWAKVRKTKGCWWWTAALSNKGRGVIHSPDGRRFLAHRASYLINNGPIADDLFVCHSCDHPACVNPKHLWLGTALDNARDAKAKGRLTRTHCKNGHKYTSATRTFALDGTQVCKICSYNSHLVSRRRFSIKYPGVPNCSTVSRLELLLGRAKARVVKYTAWLKIYRNK